MLSFSAKHLLNAITVKQYILAAS